MAPPLHFVGPMRRMLLLWGCGLVAGGCGAGLANGGFDVDCGGTPCDWQITEGNAQLGPGWHEGDPALDLSGDGRVVVEQHIAPIVLHQRGLLLEAAIVRSPGVTLRFELDWYDSTSTSAAEFWSQSPVLVDSRPVTVDETGVFHFQKQTASPSIDVQGLVFRIVKEGSGFALVDEIHLHSYSGYEEGI